jgi:hypothetical protein
MPGVMGYIQYPQARPGNWALNVALELPYAPDKTEFSAEVSQLAAKVQELLGTEAFPAKISW